MATLSFQNVAVSFPTGASAFHTKSSCQASGWVPWSVGELRLDSATYAIIFTPAGAQGRSFAKPLGCVKNAQPVPAEDCSEKHGSAFIVTTSDPVHGLIRMGFSNINDAEGFAALAQAAEAASGYSSARRSSIGCFRGGRESIASGDNSELDQLCAAIAQNHPGVCPLTFRGVELYGPDPQGEQGSEVILMRGVAVLLDPQETGRIGSYELLIYEDSNGEVAVRCPIGPRMNISPQTQESHSRMSVASRRLSMRPSVAAVLDFSANGESGWSLAFDDEGEAAAFLRDFRVRHKLMTLSLKTSGTMERVSCLQGELYEWQRWGVAATLRTWLFQGVVLLVLAVLLHAASLHYLDPERPFLVSALGAIGDATSTAASLGGVALDVGASACQMLTKGIPARAVERCAALPVCGEVRACVSQLASGHPGL